MTALPPNASTLRLGLGALGKLMPMSLWLSPEGVIRSVGPTLEKLLGPLGPADVGFFDLFELQRPRRVRDMAGLAACAGQRLKLALRDPPQTQFKGQCVRLEDRSGVLVNLSFGISVAKAVDNHNLTDSDFAPTDLAVEMLYLLEAQTAVVEELRLLNLRLREARSAAETQALTDPLTGLHNRRAMDRALQEAVAQKSGFGLLHIDLDHFKDVNDTMGHAAGDHVLGHVAQILRDETRTSDTVARVGGDEFVMILPGVTTSEALESIAQRLIKRIEFPIIIDDKVCQISASIGISASVHYPVVRPGDILGDADRALYQSKNGGRGRATQFMPPR